jgi:hypothetical protein
MAGFDLGWMVVRAWPHKHSPWLQSSPLPAFKCRDCRTLAHLRFRADPVAAPMNHHKCYVSGEDRAAGPSSRQDCSAVALLVGRYGFNFQKPFLIEDSGYDDGQRRAMCTERLSPYFSVHCRKLPRGQEDRDLD